MMARKEKQKQRVAFSDQQLRAKIETLEYLKADLQGVSTTAVFCIGIAIEDLNNLLAVGKTDVLQ